jgi:hypothetical protein
MASMLLATLTAALSSPVMFMLASMRPLPWLPLLLALPSLVVATTV